MTDDNNNTAMPYEVRCVSRRRWANPVVRTVGRFAELHDAEAFAKERTAHNAQRIIPASCTWRVVVAQLNPAPCTRPLFWEGSF